MAKLNVRIFFFSVFLVFSFSQATKSLEQTGSMSLDKSVVLIVDPVIKAGIEDSLNRFTSELSADGYNVIKHVLIENTPEQLRSYLQGIYQASSPPLVGAILIGNIPKPYFRFYYPASDECLERGPTECISFQYYQDLDGIFSRSNPGSCNHPGCYDTHSGSTDSEIWVSVLPFYYDVAITLKSINNYFTKNHEYRTGIRRSGPGYVDPLIGSQIDTPEQYQSQIDYVINSEYAWKPLTSRGKVLVGPDNSLGNPINYPNAAYCYEQAMLTDRYDFANIGAHGTCTLFKALSGGSIIIDVDWADMHNIRPHFLWDHSCNTGNIDCQPNLALTFLYNPNNYVVLVKGATSPQGGLGVSVAGASFPTIGGHLSQGCSFGDAILNHINNMFVGCYAQQKEYFIAQSILLGDGTLKLAEFLPYDSYYVFDGNDFDGNGTSDISVFRISNGRWYIKDVGSHNWGVLGDIPVNGDYNGDGTTDIAVWRPSNGKWYLRDIGGASWGMAGDTPVPDNYDGDANGTTDIAVWRPSNGRWYIQNVGSYAWGTFGDVPVPGDYNGDGKTDIAVWRPSNGRWYIRGVGSYVWGTASDTPVQADYNGDGVTEVAVWRPSNGRWYIMGMAGSSWGTSGDIPAPGDYNGDGITDIAVWRPSNGRWYIKGIGGDIWGMAGDIPLVR